MNVALPSTFYRNVPTHEMSLCYQFDDIRKKFAVVFL